MDQRVSSVEEIILPFDIELPPVKALQAGDLRCIYEAGNLRYITFGDTTIALMIYSAVRDKNWDTLPMKISNEKVVADAGGFKIQYDAVYQAEGMLFNAEIAISGMPDNKIEFSLKGKALCDFDMNRIGICLLHPLSYAGRQAKVTRPDNSEYSAEFPRTVSPHQPLLDMHKMNIAIADGINVEFILKGDIFETEDQRNWSDSSYKTYSSPASRPTPVRIKKDEVVEQRVQLTVKGEKQTSDNRKAPLLMEERIPFPKLGYGRVKGQPKLSPAVYQLLSQIPFDHYRVELAMDDSSWPDELIAAAEEAKALSCSLELVIFFTDGADKELTALAKSLETLHSLIASLLVLQKNGRATPVGLFEKVVQLIRKNYPQIKLGYGTNGHFVDINRNRPIGGNFDFVGFGINPQAHLKDTRTILDNLRGLPDTITTVRKEMGIKEVRLSPVTLMGRSGEEPDNFLASNQVADRRHNSSFAAFWTMICLQNLSGCGHITFYQLIGKAGLIYEEKTLPVFDLFRKIKSFQPKFVVRVYDHGRLLQEKCILENGAGNRMIISIASPDAS